jgi:hypothetical protein
LKRCASFSFFSAKKNKQISSTLLTRAALKMLHLSQRAIAPAAATAALAAAYAFTKSSNHDDEAGQLVQLSSFVEAKERRNAAGNNPADREFVTAAATDCMLPILKLAAAAFPILSRNVVSAEAPAAVPTEDTTEKFPGYLHLPVNDRFKSQHVMYKNLM